MLKLFITYVQLNLFGLFRFSKLLLFPTKGENPTFRCFFIKYHYRVPICPDYLFCVFERRWGESNVGEAAVLFVCLVRNITTPKWGELVWKESLYLFVIRTGFVEG